MLGTPLLLAAALIEAPPADEILYGKTEVVLGAAAGAARIDVFLEPYPDPICRLPGTGGSCPFDAGETFDARHLRAVALDAAGKAVAEDERATRGFPAPVRVEARSLMVPVVAEPPLAPEDLDCRLGKEPCRVVGLLPPADAAAPETSIAILFDVSRSMRADRRILRDRLMDLLGWLPARATVSLARFADTYEEIAPPTRDPAALRAALDGVEEGVMTCLWRSLGEALDTLATRPGLHVLVVVTDGMDSCTEANFEMPPDAAIGAVRRAAARVYVFRSGHFSQGRALESLAIESGGRVFGRGGFVGLEKALAGLANDLWRTYVADVAPGPGYREGDRLTLRHRAGTPIVTPVYVPATTEQRDLTALTAGEVEAAARLADSPTRAALRGITSALEASPDDPVLRDAFARCAAALLLHGNVRDQDAALDQAERLGKRGVRPPEPLASALRVYPKTSPEPEKYGERAAALLR